MPDSSVHQQLLYALQPHQRRLVWGGTRLTDLGSGSSDSNGIAENLDVSCMPDMPSIVESVSGETQTLAEVFGQNPSRFLGPKAPSDAGFPFLIKRLDAAKSLSIQVHPDDESAAILESEPNGKAEVWVVLDADPGAYVLLGFAEGTTESEVRGAVDDGSLPSLMRRVEVAPGDVIPVPCGCVHGIGPGVLFFEAQQPSDLTYRLFDWDRKDAAGQQRELQVDRALEVAKLDLRPDVVEPSLTLRGRGMTEWHLDDRGTFTLSRWKVAKSITRMIQTLTVFFCESGSCVIRTVGGETQTVSAGETVLLAAAACRVYVDPSPQTSLLVVQPHWRTES